MGLDLPADGLMLLVGVLLAGGAITTGFAARLRVPGPLLFLALGMLIADDGLGIVSFNNPRLAQGLATAALVVILYEGGLTTKPRDLRVAAAPGLVLATVGVFVTAGVVAGGTLLLLDVDVVTALLLGAVVSSTDAAAVFSMLRRAPLPRRLTALLEVESGANDPMAIVLTVGVLQALGEAPAAGIILGGAVLQLGGGLVVGLLVGVGATEVMNRVELGAAGLYPTLALAVAAVSYGAAAVLGVSGFLAVYVTGLLVGARVPRHRRSIRTFHDGLAASAGIGLFLLLGVLVFPAQLPGVAVSALAVTGVLVFVARPLAVALCLPWFGYRWQDLALVSWTGLRGAVPIVLATFPFTVGHPQGQLIFNVVFFVVLVSTALQGATAGLVAERLGMKQDAHPWAPVAEVVPLDEVRVELIEVDITADLHVAGRALHEVPLPPGALATTVIRGRTVLVPTGSTRMEAGDVVVVAMPRRDHAAEHLSRWARGEPPKGAGSVPDAD